MASSQPDHAGAIAHAIARLRAELSPVVTYHCVAHTEFDVMPAVVRLAGLAGIAEADRHLLEVAAAFHDIGYVQTHLDHEAIGIGIMSAVLPDYGYSLEQIACIASMIEATRMPQTPKNGLEELLADADLDSLGRDDFFPISQALWMERAALGLMISWPDWLENQYRFVKGHHYFTPVAQALRGEGKERNLAMVEQLLRDQRSAGREPD